MAKEQDRKLWGWSEKMTQHYAYIAIQRAHINLVFYHGASLPDPQHLLEGTGRQHRHIKISDISVINSAAISSLQRGAIKENEIKIAFMPHV